MPPLGPSEDPDGDRIEELHAEMQRRLQELEEMENGTAREGTSRPESAGSAPAADEVEGGEEASATLKLDSPKEEREYLGGVLPEHLRALVEQLMEEHEAPARAAETTIEPEAPLA